MVNPVKELPPGYAPAGSVSIKKASDVAHMLIWSIVLPLVCVLAILLILRPNLSSSNTFEFTSGDMLGFVGVLVLIAAIMVLHEGLHGLVFWLTTHEAPKFEFKWYYASASPRGWYLPRRPFMIATLLPLVAMTFAGLLLLPFVGAQWRYILTLLIVLNASGASGDFLVALRLAKLPPETLSFDSGAEVKFYAPHAEE